MAILHADNFSLYGTTESYMLNGVYSEMGDSDLVADPDGVSSGTVLRLTDTSPGSNTQNTLRYPFQNGAIDTVGIAHRVWFNFLPTTGSTSRINWEIRNVSNDVFATLRVLTTGGLEVILVGAGSTYSTTVPAITANGWYHLEWKFERTAAGICDFEVRVEGVTVISETAIGYTDQVPAQFAFRIAYLRDDGQLCYVKDLVIWDATTSLNNDFLGSVLVTNLTPTSDISLNWTPSVGTTGYSILDNSPPVETDYIYAEDSPIPSPYVSAMSNLPAEVTSVKALITYVRAAKSDGGDGSLQTSIISNPDTVPATVDGADRPITTAQTYWKDVFQTDPSTSAAWIPADVDKIHMKINRTT